MITIRAPGYASVERRVTPRAGLKQRISVALLTEEEARKAAIKPEITSSVGQTLVLINPQVSPVNEFTMGALDAMQEECQRGRTARAPDACVLHGDHQGRMRSFVDSHRTASLDRQEVRA